MRTVCRQAGGCAGRLQPRHGALPLERRPRAQQVRRWRLRERVEQPGPAAPPASVGRGGQSRTGGVVLGAVLMREAGVLEQDCRCRRAGCKRGWRHAVASRWPGGHPPTALTCLPACLLPAGAWCWRRWAASTRQSPTTARCWRWRPTTPQPGTTLATPRPARETGAASPTVLPAGGRACTCPRRALRRAAAVAEAVGASAQQGWC